MLFVEQRLELWWVYGRMDGAKYSEDLDEHVLVCKRLGTGMEVYLRRREEHKKVKQWNGFDSGCKIQMHHGQKSNSWSGEMKQKSQSEVNSVMLPCLEHSELNCNGNAPADHSVCFINSDACPVDQQLSSSKNTKSSFGSNMIGSGFDTYALDQSMFRS